MEGNLAQGKEKGNTQLWESSCDPVSADGSAGADARTASELHEQSDEEAHHLATEHGFDSARKVPFAEGLFHFYPKDVPPARRRRSLQHKRRLEKDHRVKSVFQQEGFGRRKRGYRDINDIDAKMNDPLFTKQWYLINTGQADGTPDWTSTWPRPGSWDTPGKG
ncbi:hypothetical protein AAFF_G00049370 [Aldrovandia affinis]|uniref:Peptidase S8 pro-domain domain-containing protein n=1 Tax=Aldrovandia affinis TaxID=143900 RepID=A0AAD7S1N4_9TELE|nr:hypothetical protein AAFF_G00049370 [Aldrovandia affinis]